MARKLIGLGVGIVVAFVVAGCSNDCDNAADDLTTIAQACGTDVVYTWTANSCDDIDRDCIEACGSTYLANDVCDTDGAAACINDCTAD